MPPMFGPVISHSRSLGPSGKSLATNRSPLSPARLDHRMAPAPRSRGTAGPSARAGTSRLRPRAAAWLAATSMRAMASAVARSAALPPPQAPVSSSACAASAASAWAPASTTRARLLVQVGRIEADHAGQRLAVGEAAVRRHQPVGVPGRHLDMIAEHRIVPDLQRRDAGRVAISRLERRDRPPAIRRRRAQASSAAS